MNLTSRKRLKGHINLACNVCGCRLYSKNFARHSRTQKHKEADYADNKFEVEKYEPQPKKKNDYIILG